MKNQAALTLTQLGFSEAEAEVYCHLLTSEAATGYAVAKQIGKAAANTYAALESLHGKGAVLDVPGKTRRYSAVPPDLLLASLDRQFDRRREQARDALQRIDREENSDGFHLLRDIDQVFARIEAAVSNAKSTILLDVFPGPQRLIDTALRDAADRGVKIALRTYGPTAPIKNAITVVSSNGSLQRRKWPGQHLHLVVDAQHYILALFDHNCTQVLQAVASDNAFFGCVYHSALLTEITDGLAQSAQEDRIALAKLKLLQIAPPGLALVEEWAKRVEEAGSGKEQRIGSAGT